MFSTHLRTKMADTRGHPLSDFLLFSQSCFLDHDYLTLISNLSPSSCIMDEIYNTTTHSQYYNILFNMQCLKLEITQWPINALHIFIIGSWILTPRLSKRIRVKWIWINVQSFGCRVGAGSSGAGRPQPRRGSRLGCGGVGAGVCTTRRACRAHQGRRHPKAGTDKLFETVFFEFLVSKSLMEELISISFLSHLY